jgi:hypothetical protein
MATCIAYIAAFTLPASNLPAISFDTSKFYALGIYAKYGLEFGKDIIHNYGPFGALWYATPFSQGGLLWGYLFRAILQALLLGGVIAFALITRRFVSMSVVLFFTIILSVHSHIEGVAIGICFIYLLLSLQSSKVPYYLVAALVTSVSLCVKLNVGLLSGVLFVAFVVTDYALHREWKRSSLQIASLTVFIVIMCLISFGSIENAVRWLQLSLTIADARSEAASLFIADTPLLFIAVCMAAALLWLSVTARRSADRARALFWIFSANFLCYMFFKHGFGRQSGGHIYLFFRLVPFVLVSSIFVIPLRKSLAPIVVVVMLSIIASYNGAFPKSEISTMLHLKMNFGGVRNMLNIEPREKFIRKKTEKFLAQNGLMTTEQKIVSGSTLAVYPWQVLYIHNSLARWKPQPNFQDLNVNKALDDFNAYYFQSDDAAKHILLVWRSADHPSNGDKRHIFQSSPATVRAIAQNYQPVHSQSGRVLLERMQQEEAADMHLVSTAKAQWNTPVTVPKSQKPLIAVVHANYSTYGKIKKTLFRVDPVTMEIQYADQLPQLFRIIPNTAKNGVLVQYLPRNVEEAVSFLGHSMPSTMQKPHSLLLQKKDGAFLPDIEIDFYEWDWELL